LGARLGATYRLPAQRKATLDEAYRNEELKQQCYQKQWNFYNNHRKSLLGTYPTLPQLNDAIPPGEEEVMTFHADFAWALVRCMCEYTVVVKVSTFGASEARCLTALLVRLYPPPCTPSHLAHDFMPIPRHFLSSLLSHVILFH
jgi:hypothetical protein